MAGDNCEWVYLHSDDEKTSPKAASAMSVPAAFDDATEVVVTAPHDTDDEDTCSSEDDEDNYSDYSNEGRLERAYESDEELDQVDEDEALPDVDFATLPLPVPSACWDSDDATEVVTAAHDTDDEDDEDGYSDYSNEDRLERAYESDEDLDHVEDEEALPEVASVTLPLPLPVSSSGWDSDDATEVGIAVAADVEWSGGQEHGDNMDDQDACSDDEDYYTDYSMEGLLEGAYESDSDEKASLEAASSMPVPLPSACLASDHAKEVADAGGAVDEHDEDACSDEDDYSDYSNEGRLERAYQSDEDIDQVDEDASDMKKLLDNLLDDESDQATFDLDMRKMLGILRSIADRRKATSNEVYGEGVYGGKSGYGYGGGGVYGNYYGGPGGGYYGGISDHYHYGGLSDFDYGSGRDYDGLSDHFDYGNGGRCYGGLSDFGYAGGRGYYGGISDYDYYGHLYSGDRYLGGLHQQAYDVPAYTQYHPFPPMPPKAPTEDELLGSWKQV